MATASGVSGGREEVYTLFIHREGVPYGNEVMTMAAQAALDELVALAHALLPPRSEAAAARA